MPKLTAIASLLASMEFDPTGLVIGSFCSAPGAQSKQQDLQKQEQREQDEASCDEWAYEGMSPDSACSNASGLLSADS